MTNRLMFKGLGAVAFTVGCVVLFVLLARLPDPEPIPTHTTWIDSIYVTPTNCLTYRAGFGTEPCIGEQ